MIRRSVSAFDKDTGRLAAEFPLGVDFAKLSRRYAKEAEDDPLLVHEYEITPGDAEFYRSAGIPLDFGRFDYFLSCAED